MDQNYCRFCHQPCGERSFCDEVCYEGYEIAMEEELHSYAEQMIDEE